MQPYVSLIVSVVVVTFLGALMAAAQRGKPTAKAGSLVFRHSILLRGFAVLAAFGTPRTTLAWSVVWQTAVPVVLGLALAVAGGTGLGVVLQRMVGAPVSFDWAGTAALAAAGGALILAVTACSLPALWRMMRPEGLRSE